MSVFCDFSFFFGLSRLSGVFGNTSLVSFQSGELVKAYPPFVNFFEMSKETIVKCEKQKPRFHAFLKVFNISLTPPVLTGVYYIKMNIF